MEIRTIVFENYEVEIWFYPDVKSSFIIEFLRIILKRGNEATKPIKLLNEKLEEVDFNTVLNEEEINFLNAFYSLRGWD